MLPDLTSGRSDRLRSVQVCTQVHPPKVVGRMYGVSRVIRSLAGGGANTRDFGILSVFVSHCPLCRSVGVSCSMRRTCTFAWPDV
jgi:hypothetical protein